MPEGMPFGDVAEKVIPLVRFPILMRVILPGLCAGFMLFPFTGIPIKNLEIDGPTDLAVHLVLIIVICGAVFVLGAIIAAINGQIYKVYEGRSLWPHSLRAWGVRRQQARVKDLRSHATYDPSPDPHAENLRLESWDQLRTYPLNASGDYHGKMPTRLGNILAGYEQYPLLRYQMSSIFYFPRIWIQMDKETRDNIDSGWAIADGFLALSATLLVGGVLWIAVGIIGAFHCFSLPIPLGRSTYSIAGGAALLISSYGVYRLSLPFHLQNGELFRTIFDLYRDKVWRMTELENNELEAWKSAWLYYQYFRVRCQMCGEEWANGQRVLPSQECPNCGFTNRGFRKGASSMDVL